MTVAAGAASLAEAEIERVVTACLEEDLGRGDLTSNAVIPEDAGLDVCLRARESIVVAGLPVALRVFERLTPGLVVKVLRAEGMRAGPGEVIARMQGPARGILAAERTALNLFQHLSGIATLTRAFVDRIEGTGAVLLDTRKTIPGLRALCKYATRIGGASNHRMRLDDWVLIKDNHVAVAGGVAEAVRRARAAGLDDIEVECDTIDQVEEALAVGIGRILLDNMDPAALRRAVDMVAGRAVLEASGGVRLETVRAIAETGVDFISTGQITQGARAVDIGLDVVHHATPPGGLSPGS